MNSGCYIQYSGRDANNRSCIKQILYSNDFSNILVNEKIICYGSGGRDVQGPHIYEKDSFFIC